MQAGYEVKVAEFTRQFQMTGSLNTKPSTINYKPFNH